MTTDLKPGDIVQHPERRLNGLVVHGDGESIRVLYLTSLGIVTTTSNLTGWERVETVRPGHVQVRIDDLADELRRYATLGQGPACLESNVMLRVTRALDAQCAESTPPADEQTDALADHPADHSGGEMTSTDLKPGDFVRHPEKGNGVVYDSTPSRVMHRNALGRLSSSNLDDWERVETCTADERRILDDFREVASGEAQEAVYPEEGVVIASHADFEQRPELVKPGHMQVRVDDIDPQIFSNWSQGTAFNAEDEALIRIGLAFVARQVEQGDPPSQVDEKPTSTTVTLPCPDCGEAITREVRPVRVENSRTPKWSLEFLRSPGVVGERSHACQPDEPTEFGARVTVTLPDGTREKRLRVANGDDWPWRNSDGDRHFWAYLIERGTVTLGWEQE